MMGVEITAGAATDVGMVRTNNQDSFLIASHLWVVADGMGGHAGGEVASRVAVDTMEVVYAEPGEDNLRESIVAANEAVLYRADQEPDLSGMGTTVCAISLVGDQLLVANVGDSRAYRYRNGELTRMTEDHSLVEDMVRAGRLTPEEARYHPQRNILTRSLGHMVEVRADIDPVDAVPGDRYVICSDGLFNEVADPDIVSVLASIDEPEEAARALVRRANEGGGHDNITVIVLNLTGTDDAAIEGSAAVIADGDAGNYDATTALPVVPALDIDPDRPVPTTPAPALEPTPPAAAAAADPDDTSATSERPGSTRRQAAVVVAIAFLLVIGGLASQFKGDEPSPATTTTQRPTTVSTEASTTTTAVPTTTTCPPVAVDPAQPPPPVTDPVTCQPPTSAPPPPPGGQPQPQP